jgi:hypothetical protein
MNKLTQAALLLLPAALPLPTAASEFLQSASGACFGETILDAVAIHRDALGIKNISTRPVSVVCSATTVAMMAPPNTQFEVTRVSAEFTNDSSRRVSMSCLYTDVDAAHPQPQDPVTFQLKPKQSLLVNFQGTGDRVNQATFALSCVLPAGVELNTIGGRVLEWEFQPME